jgi:hypothetical protein
MLPGPAAPKGGSAQGPRRKATPGKRKGKAKKAAAAENCFFKTHPPAARSERLRDSEDDRAWLDW